MHTNPVPDDGRMKTTYLYCLVPLEFIYAFIKNILFAAFVTSVRSTAVSRLGIG